MAKVTIAALAAATASAAGFMYATEKDAKHLVEKGLAEVGAVNPENAKEFAIRATDAGMAEAAKETATGASAASSGSKFEFRTYKAADREATKSRSGRSTKYPFDDFPEPSYDNEGNLLEGPEIFIAATEKMPDPAKSLSSTVSAANRRYAVVTGTKPGKNKKGEDIQKNIYDFKRKFEIAAVDGGAVIRRVK